MRKKHKVTTPRMQNILSEPDERVTSTNPAAVNPPVNAAPSYAPVIPAESNSLLAPPSPSSPSPHNKVKMGPTATYTLPQPLITPPDTGSFFLSCWIKNCSCGYKKRLQKIV